MAELKLLTPEQVWNKLSAYKNSYYDSMSAMYSGDHSDLAHTSPTKGFWQRKSNKCPIHVPIAADIAATSANLLFSNEPTYTIVHDKSDKEDTKGIGQKRLEDIIRYNSMGSKLTESAETCAALGDIYLKCRWNAKTSPFPIVDIAQPDASWPEYVLGELRAVHFFTDLSIDTEKDTYIRIYECYEKGKIKMAVYQGKRDSLGTKMNDTLLRELGYAPEIKAPVDELLAVHIPNIRPNRRFRSAMHGRSDLDGIRDLCDSLDEAYSSWMRDIRLGKAKMVVPAEYLRKNKNTFTDNVDTAIGASGVYEFDSDVETYVAMDINTDTAGVGIIQSQFAIRAAEHESTCRNLIVNILHMAGYSPQTFGVNSEGTSPSGRALNIRERKSAVTKDKKLTYWQSTIEHILTCLVKIDAAIYKGKGSNVNDRVSIEFADSMGAEIGDVASTVNMMASAKAASTVTKIRMLHPDWDEQQVNDELASIQKEEVQYLLPQPDMNKGDLENDEEDEKTDKKEDEGSGS